MCVKNKLGWMKEVVVANNTSYIYADAHGMSQYDVVIRLPNLALAVLPSSWKVL